MPPHGRTYVTPKWIGEAPKIVSQLVALVDDPDAETQKHAVNILVHRLGNDFSTEGEKENIRNEELLDLFEKKLSSATDHSKLVTIEILRSLPNGTKRATHLLASIALNENESVSLRAQALDALSARDFEADLKVEGRSYAKEFHNRIFDLLLHSQSPELRWEALAVVGSRPDAFITVSEISKTASQSGGHSNLLFANTFKTGLEKPWLKDLPDSASHLVEKIWRGRQEAPGIAQAAKTARDLPEERQWIPQFLASCEQIGQLSAPP